MKLKHLMLLTIILSILFPFSSSTEQVQTHDGYSTDFVYIDLEKGWNLVPSFTNSPLSSYTGYRFYSQKFLTSINRDSDYRKSLLQFYVKLPSVFSMNPNSLCSANDLMFGYAYSSYQQSYLRLSVNDSADGIQLVPIGTPAYPSSLWSAESSFSLKKSNYIGQYYSYKSGLGSYWVYSSRRCVLASQADLELEKPAQGSQGIISKNDLRAFSSWNFFNIHPSIVELTPNSLFKDCGLARIYFWEPRTQSWTRVSNLNLKFSSMSAFIGYGFIAKLDNVCDLDFKVPDEIPVVSPPTPQLPSTPLVKLKSNIQVTSITGIPEDGKIVSMAAQIRHVPGEQYTDLSRMKITISNTLSDLSQTYSSSTLSSSTFTASQKSDPHRLFSPGTPLMDSSSMVEIQLNTSKIAIWPDNDVVIEFLSDSMIPEQVYFRTPFSFGSRVNMYP